jgi:tetratricopeptide (TPR) repeat protein
MTKVEIIFIVLFSAMLAGNLANGQDRMLADNFLKLAEEYKSKSNPDSAIYYYEKAAIENEKIGNIEEEIDAFNQIGVLLTRQGNYDEARSMAEQGIGKRPRFIRQQ